MIPVVNTARPPVVSMSKDETLMHKARELEAAFLSEMLSLSGLGKEPESFGGGAGEEQFSSFLRAEQAKLLVERGGIGLAEGIFRSLKQVEGERNELP